MRFFVPEWDDAVDAEYDFVHDEHSTLDRSARCRHFIWDIFDYESTPIDGVLISREKVEESMTKFERFMEHGVYDDPVLDIPEWMPTISDCGAWGYRSLPFPPYDAEEMLDFYEKMDVDIGVTIDHLVLGSGKEGRLYLNERALEENVSGSTIPEALKDRVDLMIDEWPGEEQKWPAYVKDEEPSIFHAGPVNQFQETDFEGSPREILARLADDPRAVYREDDTRYRYNLTLRNAETMKRLYDEGEYPFRLMAAVQGWEPTSYARATERVLEIGYDYLGIGGVAGSRGTVIEEIVSEVGSVVKSHERQTRKRVESHIFGFAKTDLFETVGRAGMTSFDSASMLRSAWEGGNNYHINGEQYAALRVRFGLSRDNMEVAIEKALRGQELLRSLRAFDDEKSIFAEIARWQTLVDDTLEGLLDYIEDVRHDGVYNDFDRLRDTKEYFRDDYKFGREVSASLSRKFRTRLIKLLRDDTSGDPTPYREYIELVDTARDVFDSTFPNMHDTVRRLESDEGDVATTRQILAIAEDYTHSDVIGDEGHFEDYKELLGDRPWDDCSCPICDEHGIEVAVFRGNNRNRRRGFHNMRQFYDQFEHGLPKIMVATPVSLTNESDITVAEFLADKAPEFWNQVHDLPVTEVGAISADRFFEWWETPANEVSDDTVPSLHRQTSRYQEVYLFDPNEELSLEDRESLIQSGCEITLHESAESLREAVLSRLGYPYPDDFLPSPHTQSNIGAW